MSQHASGSSSAPRHGRHAAGSGGARPSRASTRQQAAPVAQRFPGADERRANLREALPVIGSDSTEQDAPRPVLDPAATGSFRRIEVGEGATVENRENVSRTSPNSANLRGRAGLGGDMRLHGAHAPQFERHETKVRGDRRIIIPIALLVVALLCGGAFLFQRIMTFKPAETSQQEVEQTQTAIEGAIEYRGTRYYLKQNDTGGYDLVSQSASSTSGSSTTLFTLSGTPVQLVLYNGALVIPENLSDGSWDVIAYTMGAGGLPTQVVDADGNAVGGQGELVSVSLEDPNLVVTDSSGSTTTVALA